MWEVRTLAYDSRWRVQLQEGGVEEEEGGGGWKKTKSEKAPACSRSYHQMMMVHRERPRR